MYQELNAAHAACGKMGDKDCAELVDQNRAEQTQILKEEKQSEAKNHVYIQWATSPFAFSLSSSLVIASFFGMCPFLIVLSTFVIQFSFIQLFSCLWIVRVVVSCVIHKFVQFVMFQLQT